MMGGLRRGRILVSSTKQRRLLDAYRFPGFRPMDEVRGVFGDPNARIITLVRRSRNRPAGRGTIASFVWLGIFRPAASVNGCENPRKDGGKARTSPLRPPFLFAKPSLAAWANVDPPSDRLRGRRGRRLRTTGGARACPGGRADGCWGGDNSLLAKMGQQTLPLMLGCRRMLGRHGSRVLM